MKKRKLTVKQYAEEEFTSVFTINNRIYRGTLKSIKADNGLTYVFPDTDTTQKKRRYRQSLKRLEHLLDIESIGLSLEVKEPLTEKQDKEVKFLISFIQEYEDKRYPNLTCIKHQINDK